MSTAIKIALTLAVTLTVAANSAFAQTSQSGGVRRSNHNFFRGTGHDTRHYGGYGYQRYRYGYHGYIAPNNGYGFGAAAHGVADIIRSRAHANLTNAHASSQREVARTQRLGNDVLALETRLQRQHINKTSRFGHLHARGAEMAELKLAAAAAMPPAADGKRLGPADLEPETGRLAWPLLLAMSHFENLRRPIDEVFAARASAGSLHPDDYLPLLDLIDDVMADVDANAAIFPKRDYADAQDFLRRMKAEARLPAIPAESGVHLASRSR